MSARRRVRSGEYNLHIFLRLDVKRMLRLYIDRGKFKSASEAITHLLLKVTEQDIIDLYREVAKGEELEAEQEAHGKAVVVECAKDRYEATGDI